VRVDLYFSFTFSLFRGSVPRINEKFLREEQNNVFLRTEASTMPYLFLPQFQKQET